MRYYVVVALFLRELFPAGQIAEALAYARYHRGYVVDTWTRERIAG